jgi:putative addiction module component (TIGR02574 family)
MIPTPHVGPANAHRHRVPVHLSTPPAVMDISATLNEIASLTVEERIHIVQAIWDSIAAEQAYPDLTEAQKQELDRRIEDAEANPDDVLTWAEVKASIKGQE